MQKQPSSLTFWTVHLAHWALLYAAFIQESAGALNVIRLLTWLCGLVAALGIAVYTLSGFQLSMPTKWPWHQRMLTKAQSFATLALLAWHGYIATAMAWALVMAWAQIGEQIADEAEERSA